MVAMGSPVQSLETQATTPAAPALAEAAIRPESPAATTTEAKRPAPPYHYYPFWSPRFWHGMTLGPWLRLLRRNGLLSVHPFRYPLLIAVTFFSSLNGASASFSGSHTANAWRRHRCRQLRCLLSVTGVAVRPTCTNSWSRISVLPVPPACNAFYRITGC